MTIFWSGLLVSMFSMWRETEGKQNWVHYPSDPAQLEAETRLILQAIVVWIAMFLIQDRAEAEGEDVGSAEGEDVGSADERGDGRHARVTVDEVLDHWEERAAECSVAFLLLLWARLVFFIFEMKATEERNDWRRYLSFYPILLCLWAVAHCPNYVVITASEISFWALASTAQLAFQAHFGFCRLSRFGKWQWADLFMEKRINDMRYFVGKQMGPGMRKKMEDTAADLPGLIARRDEMGGNKQARARRGYSFGHPFWLMLRWLDMTNALGKLGSAYYTLPKQNPGGVGDFTKRTRHETSAAPRTACDDHLNPDIYSLLQKGRERVTPVCAGVADQSESTDATLFLLGATLDDASNSDYLLWARRYSTDPAVLGQKIGQQRLYGDDLVKRELGMLLNKGIEAGLIELTAMQVQLPSLDTAGRTQMLCEARKAFTAWFGEEVPPAPTAREGCSAERGRELAADALQHPFLKKPARPDAVPAGTAS